MIPGRKLANTREYPGYTGKALVEWQPSPMEADKTKLNFTFSILGPFDPKEEALKRTNFVAGWNHIVPIGLKEFVE